MDIQVQELIDRIKKEGIASAESSAAAIISGAKKQAEEIIAGAEKKAAGLVENARAETARMEKSSIDAIEQAGRNLVLSFRDSVCAQLAAVVAAKTEKAYSPEALAALVPATVKAWAKNPEAESLAVLLSPKDLDALEGAFKSSLGAELSRGLELKADPSLASGFRIGSKDGSAYYDYSAESVAALFSSYLNPRVSAIMKDAAGVLKG